MWKYIAVLIAFCAVCAFAYRTGGKVEKGRCDADKLVLQAELAERTLESNRARSKVRIDAARGVVDERLLKFYID